MSIVNIQECLEDWQKFNGFHWPEDVDIGIAQELYTMYVAYMDSSLNIIEKVAFTARCRSYEENGTLADMDDDELWEQHARGEHLPETLEEILYRAKAYQYALEEIL